jgi:hypothetical protein
MGVAARAAIRVRRAKNDEEGVEMETGNGLFMRFGDVSGQKVLPGASGHMLHTGLIVPSQNVYRAMQSYRAVL